MSTQPAQKTTTVVFLLAFSVCAIQLMKKVLFLIFFFYSLGIVYETSRRIMDN